MIQYVAIFFAIILGLIIGGVLLYQVFGLIHRQNLKNAETPQAWIEILGPIPTYQNLIDEQKKALWSWIQLALGSTSLDGPNEGHIPIEERLKILLELYFELDESSKRRFLKTDVWIIHSEPLDEEFFILWNGKKIQKIKGLK